MEATIIINGIELTHGQAMAVRAALIEMQETMSNSNACGDDAHGRAMTKAYFDRSSEVLEIINQ